MNQGILVAWRDHQSKNLASRISSLTGSFEPGGRAPRRTESWAFIDCRTDGMNRFCDYLLINVCFIDICMGARICFEMFS